MPAVAASSASSGQAMFCNEAHGLPLLGTVCAPASVWTSSSAARHIEHGSRRSSTFLLWKTTCKSMAAALSVCDCGRRLQIVLKLLTMPLQVLGPVADLGMACSALCELQASCLADTGMHACLAQSSGQLNARSVRAEHIRAMLLTTSLCQNKLALLLTVV